jgi:NADH dehydrogenase [ubiquinone] 1 alpha subcomplex assembly factor 7
VAGAAELVADRIARLGPIPFSDYLELVLYDERLGFYETGGGSGRRGDFITSPEIGPLFGAVIARALDTWWRELGRPDPFVVVDAGAGPGTLARAVLAARPACSGALRYVLCERSSAQRARHGEGLPLVPAAQAFSRPRGSDDYEEPLVDVTGRGPLAVSLGELPAGPFTGVVLANELLDNLPFDLLVHDGEWREAHVALGDGGRLVELLVPARRLPAYLPPRPPHGARAPVSGAAVDWLARALERLERGRVVMIDYASTTAQMAMRPYREWLRTYRDQQRGGHYLAHLGEQDITADVPLDQLAAVRTPETVQTQAEFLVHHGLDDLVEEGRRVWLERAHLGDLAALTGRSRVREAEALTASDGLGAFTVAEWRAR